MKAVKDCSVYLLRNLIDGKGYVGKASCRPAEKRWAEHIADSKKSHLYLHRAIRKYGVENFSAEVVHTCTLDVLDAAEVRFIKKLGTLAPNGYNMVLGSFGGKPSPLMYERMVASIRTPEARAKKSKSGLAAIAADPDLVFRRVRNLIGRKRPEHARLMSQLFKGRPASDAERERLNANNAERAASGYTSSKMKAHWAKPEERAKHSERIKKFCIDNPDKVRRGFKRPEGAGAKTSASLQAFWASEAGALARKKAVEARTAYWAARRAVKE